MSDLNVKVAAIKDKLEADLKQVLADASDLKQHALQQAHEQWGAARQGLESRLQSIEREVDGLEALLSARLTETGRTLSAEVAAATKYLSEAGRQAINGSEKLLQQGVQTGSALAEQAKASTHEQTERLLKAFHEHAQKVRDVLQKIRDAV